VKGGRHWELFALNTHPLPKLAWKVCCPLSKWNANNGQTIHSPHKNNLKKTSPLPHPQQKKREAPSFHDTTSHLVAWKF